MWIILGLLIWMFLCGTVLISASFAVSLDSNIYNDSARRHYENS
jgi:hypothetical protein